MLYLMSDYYVLFIRFVGVGNFWNLTRVHCDCISVKSKAESVTDERRSGVQLRPITWSSEGILTVISARSNWTYSAPFTFFDCGGLSSYYEPLSREHTVTHV